jgi:hypothetical protein
MSNVKRLAYLALSITCSLNASIAYALLEDSCNNQNNNAHTRYVCKDIYNQKEKLSIYAPPNPEVNTRGGVKLDYGDNSFTQPKDSGPAQRQPSPQENKQFQMF